jgi:hypothetical protein
LNSITDDTQVSDSASGGLRARLERYERSAGGGIKALVDGSGAPEPPPLEVDEPISPELVLVDPELALRARALLPDPRPFTVSEPEPEYDPEANRVVLGEVEPAAEPALLPRRRSRKRRAAAYALALVVLAAVAAAIAFAVMFRSGNDSAAPSDGNAPGPIVPAKQAPPSAQPPAPAASPRSFVWAPVHGAASYLVQFYRAGTEIFRARPSQARVVVPAHWSFKGREYSLEPGHYRWSVRPRLARQRYGKPVVLSQLVVQRASSGGGQSTRSP